jgi:hypothetical protein
MEQLVEFERLLFHEKIDACLDIVTTVEQATGQTEHVIGHRVHESILPSKFNDTLVTLSIYETKR